MHLMYYSNILWISPCHTGHWAAHHILIWFLRAFFASKQMATAFKSWIKPLCSCNHCLYIWGFWTADYKWVRSEHLGACPAERKAKLLNYYVQEQCKSRGKSRTIWAVSLKFQYNTYFVFSRLTLFWDFPTTSLLCRLCFMPCSPGLWAELDGPL